MDAPIDRSQDRELIVQGNPDAIIHWTSPESRVKQLRRSVAVAEWRATRPARRPNLVIIEGGVERSV